MTNELIDTKQIELHFEAANDAAEKSSKMARGAVIEAIEAGEQLCQAKECVPHGEWATWLGKHWNYSHSLAIKYMLISNSECVTNLKEAKSINEALRMIADDKEEKTAPRSERKTGQVEVVEPKEEDADPTPDPPTIRKTASGSAKKPEASKPKTAAIVPEIIDDPKESFPEETTLSDFTEQQILDFLVATAEEPKPRAKRLRKTADKLDPPTKFVKPDSGDVLAFLRVYAASDEFISKNGKRTDLQLATAAEEFIDHYASNGWMVGKVAMKDWHATARKWLRNQDQFASTKTPGKSGTARVPAPPRKPVVYHE